MKAKTTPIAWLAGLALAAGSINAMADSTEADCVVHERGEKKQNQSGSCLFSQRQGYVDIRLNNGKEYNLTPQDKPNVFNDQNGQRVKREASGNEHRYIWEHKNIKVRFNGGGSSHDSGQAHSAEPTTTTERLHFDASGSGGEVSDSLTPGSSKRYVLHGRDGQMLYVRVAARGAGMYYQVFNPDNSFMVEQTSASQELRNGLWQNGDHVIEVINRGNGTVSYNLIFGLQ